jgi:hypothetical protein
MGAHTRGVTCIDVAFSRLFPCSVWLFILGLTSCCGTFETAVVGRSNMLNELVVHISLSYSQCPFSVLKASQVVVLHIFSIILYLGYGLQDGYVDCVLPSLSLSAELTPLESQVASKK